MFVEASFFFLPLCVVGVGESGALATVSLRKSNRSLSLTAFLLQCEKEFVVRNIHVIGCQCARCFLSNALLK